MNHLQFIQSESYVSPSEHRWEAWIGKVSTLTGRTFDLNSADESDAHDAFLALVTPEAYAAELRAAKSE